MKHHIFQKRKRKYNRYVLIGLFLVFFLSEISIWITTDGFPAMMDQWESYHAYMAGNNFEKFGIVKLRFLEDQATSSTEDAHPYLYTHHQNFPIFVTYFLIKIGIKSIATQHFFMIFILGLGLFYLYLTVREYTYSNQLALFVLAISVINYSAVLIYGFNLVRAWSWFVMFAPLYHIKRYASDNVKYHFWLGVFFYFLVTYFDYGILLYFTCVLLLLKIFGFYNRLSLKRFWGILLLGILPAFLLHKIFIIWALGFDFVIKDFVQSISNRVTGNPTYDELVHFYQTYNVVLWRGAGGRYKDLFSCVQRDLGFTFGKFYITSLIMSFLVLGIKVFVAKFKPKLINRNKSNIIPVSVKLFGAFFIPLIPLFFVKYFASIYLSGSRAPLVVFSVSIGGGTLLYLLINNIGRTLSCKPVKNVKVIILSIVTTFFVYQVVTIPYFHLTNMTPIKSTPGHKILTKYKGYSFRTNTPAPYVNYFTGNWVNMSWTTIDRNNISGVPVDEYIKQLEFLFERDKKVNKEKYLKPDFLLILNKPGLPNVPDPEWDVENYSLVEKVEKENIWIFDLRRKGGGG